MTAEVVNAGMKHAIRGEQQPGNVGAASGPNRRSYCAASETGWIGNADVGAFRDQVDRGRVEIEIVKCALTVRAEIQEQPLNPALLERCNVTAECRSRVRVKVIRRVNTLLL